MTEEPTVQSRFGLARPNLVLDPAEDTDCFARDDINIADLVENLRIDLVTGLAPKRIFWGPYGGGKTHTLYKAMRELHGLTPIYPVHIECPDLGRKSSFLDLYRDGILRNMGEEFVMELFNKALERVGVARREELIAKLRAITEDEELAKVISQLLSPNFDPVLIWGWISGIALSRTELSELKLTQSLADAEPARLANMVVLLGRMVRKLLEKTLVLILDEMERLKGVGADTIPTFVTGFTRVADPNQKHVSILIGCSAAVLDEMPDVFALDGPVISRLGPNARTEITDMSDPIVDDFIRKVIAYVRDETADIPALIKSAEGSTSESLTEDLFPFTEAAIDNLKSQLTQQMTPREITLRMTHALGKAHLTNRLCVTSETIG